MLGKRMGRHSLLQNQTTELSIAKAREHAVVVRLKGGDPFIFGRGGEEMEDLVAAGIPVEVVPGVTSGIAAPAYAGIPLTHRNYSSSVIFVTGHEMAGKYRPGVNWQCDRAERRDDRRLYGRPQSRSNYSGINAGGIG